MIAVAEDLTVSDEALSEFMESVEEDFTVGVKFNPLSRTYTYLAPPTTRVGNWVLVPPNSFRSEPAKARVVALNPTPPRGVRLARVLEVLT